MSLSVVLDLSITTSPICSTQGEGRQMPGGRLKRGRGAVGCQGT